MARRKASSQGASHPKNGGTTRAKTGRDAGTGAAVGGPRSPAKPGGGQPHRPGRSRQSGGARGPIDPGLLFGHHAVFAALANPNRHILAIWCTVDLLDRVAEVLSDRPDDQTPAPPPPTVMEKADIDRKLPEGSVHQGLVIRVEPLPELAIEDLLERIGENPKATVVVLDQVTDPHNVGAILRSTAAFGAAGVIVQDRHAPPMTATLAKTASGAVDICPIVRVTNLARAMGQLKEAGFWCVGLAEETETDLADANLTGRTALVLGAEGDGLRRLTRETCDVLVRLPTQAPIHSLNVSAAAAIALYQITLRHSET
jgi:23S rRNA (guanosine2251-2'-O)-methyltransferase